MEVGVNLLAIYTLPKILFSLNPSNISFSRPSSVPKVFLFRSGISKFVFIVCLISVTRVFKFTLFRLPYAFLCFTPSDAITPSLLLAPKPASKRIGFSFSLIVTVVLTLLFSSVVVSINAFDIPS